MSTKVCSDCKIEKSKTDYYLKNKKTGQVQSYCKSCSNIRRIERDRRFREKGLHKREMKVIEITTTCNCCKETKNTIGNFNPQSNGINFEKVCKSCKNEQVRNKLMIDPIFKMKRHIRTMIRKSIKKGEYTKQSKTYDILGIDYKGFKNHIENLFIDGMNWNNHGKWHYDHIVPLVSANTYEEIIKLNHYTNIQPLWAKDNLKKGSKIL